MYRWLYLLFSVFSSQLCFGQIDSAQVNLSPTEDSVGLRIKNLSPYFNLHIDSVINYQMVINKPITDYYWYISDAPAGLGIDKDNGMLSIKVNKNYFLSGRLKYDKPYRVKLTVQNLNIAADKLDTSFVVAFYNTEILPSRLKPTVTKDVIIDEGDTLFFKVQCDNGSFPITDITYVSNYTIKSISRVAQCGDDFTWPVPYGFVKQGDRNDQRLAVIYLVGSTKFRNSDTAVINVMVRKNINYPEQVKQFAQLRSEVERYINSLKSSFRLVDKKIRKTKRTRTTFDLASASTALGGTVFSSLSNPDQRTVGKILPSVGVALVPVKEATAPNSSYEQNTASLIRRSIKRLEYLLADNRLNGEKDPEIMVKYRKLKDELLQTQVQLIDIPLSEALVDEQEVDKYFNSDKVNKKYRLRKRK